MISKFILQSVVIHLAEWSVRLQWPNIHVSFLIVECSPLDYLNLSGHLLSTNFTQALMKSVHFAMEREMPTPNFF
jgi:hypothetical protein